MTRSPFGSITTTPRPASTSSRIMLGHQGRTCRSRWRRGRAGGGGRRATRSPIGRAWPVSVTPSGFGPRPGGGDPGWWGNALAPARCTPVMASSVGRWARPASSAIESRSPRSEPAFGQRPDRVASRMRGVVVVLGVDGERGGDSVSAAAVRRTGIGAVRWSVPWREERGDGVANTGLVLGASLLGHDRPDPQLRFPASVWIVHSRLLRDGARSAGAGDAG